MPRTHLALAVAPSPRSPHPCLVDRETESLRCLMLSYVAGDDHAGDLLARRLRGPLLGVARRYVSGRAEAEDLVQDALLRAHLHRHEFDPERVHSDGAVVAWFAKVMRNRSVDLLRSRSARIRGHERAFRESEQALASPEEFAVARESSEVVVEHMREAVAMLPATQREVVRLHRLEGVPLREVAARLHLTYAAVKVRAHRGYAKLRELVEGPDHSHPAWV